MHAARLADGGDELGGTVRRNDHHAVIESKDHGALRVGHVRPIPAELAISEPPGHGEETAVAHDPKGAAHGRHVVGDRGQLDEIQPGLPPESLDAQRVSAQPVASDHVAGAAEDHEHRSADHQNAEPCRASRKEREDVDGDAQ